MFFTSIHKLLLSVLVSQVRIYEDTPPRAAWRIWKLIPVKVGEVFTPSQPSFEVLGLGSLPSYDGDVSQPPTSIQHAESESDEFGTVVTEVTIVTTRKKYRVEDT